MLRTKLYIAIALVTVLLPAPAVYAADDTTTGQFTAGASTPEVTDIEIFTDIGCTIPATNMDPLTQYYAKVDVTLANGLKHLDTVQATVYYDADGTPGPVPTTGDLHDCAILTCTVSGPTWTIAAGTSTSWDIVSANCTQPDFTGNPTSGSWIFAFDVGIVARENIAPAEWNAEGKAINGTKHGEDYVYDKNMNWYGEIAVNSPALVDWGEVPLGLTSDNSTYNPETDISVTYIANGDYNQDISSTDWSNAGPPVETVTLNTTGTEPLTNPGEFGLKASWHNVLADNVTVLDNPNYATINNTETITDEDGEDFTANTLWLSLSTSGIAPVQYSGTIWYQVSNR